MGGTTWSSDAYQHLKTDYSRKSVDNIFTSNKSKKTADTMSPIGLKFRESRDSDAHPETLAVAVFLDVTGSMGMIPEKIVREKMGTLMETLINHDLKDAQVLFGAIGDHLSDRCPIQVGQFESGTDELTSCLTSTYLEGNGGGQNKESYSLAWLIAARHTSIDCFEKRGQKGILFTIGDEKCWETLQADRLKDLMGYEESEDIDSLAILHEAQKSYHVFHIHVNETGNRNDKDVIGHWKNLVGERLIILEDHNEIAEVIAATVAMIHGVDLDDITKNFDAKTASGVKTALMHVDTSITKASSGVIKL